MCTAVDVGLRASQGEVAIGSNTRLPEAETKHIYELLILNYGYNFLSCMKVA